MKLPPFWTKDCCFWFTLTESTFNHIDIADPRLHFDLLLPALPEEVIEQVRRVLHTDDDIPDPYPTNKARLMEFFTPKPLDQCQKIIFGPELGNRRRSQLLETMLALLPPGETNGLLFKAHFINRLPSNVRNHVVARGFTLSSREMAAVVDDLWFAKNSHQYSNKHHSVAPVVPKDTEELEEAVAVLNVQPSAPPPPEEG